MIKFDDVSQVPNLLGKECYETFYEDMKDVPSWDYLELESKQRWTNAALRIYSTTLLQFNRINLNIKDHE